MVLKNSCFSLCSEPLVYSFDHCYPSADDSIAPLVVLYGELGSPEFALLHSALSEMAARNEIQYIFRHYYKVTRV